MSEQQGIGQEDWRRLSQLWAELDPNEVKKAMRRAMVKIAKRVRDTAAAKLSSLPIKHADEVAKTLWTQVSIAKSKPAYFRASAGFKRKPSKGVHLNERGRLKPAAMWLEAGTKERCTKGRSPHSTGSVRGYGYMLDTTREEEPRAADDLRAAFEAEVQARSKKLGFF